MSCVRTPGRVCGDREVYALCTARSVFNSLNIFYPRAGGAHPGKRNSKHQSSPDRNRAQRVTVPLSLEHRGAHSSRYRPLAGGRRGPSASCRRPRRVLIRRTVGRLRQLLVLRRAHRLLHLVRVRVRVRVRVGVRVRVSTAFTSTSSFSIRHDRSHGNLVGSLSRSKSPEADMNGKLSFVWNLTRGGTAGESGPHSSMSEMIRSGTGEAGGPGEGREGG